MSLRTPLTRCALAALLAALLSGAAFAATTESLVDETLIVARTASGQAERLRIADIGNLAVGESRAYTTQAGNGATLTRNESNYMLEIAGETFDINMPDVSPEGLADGVLEGLPDGAHVVKIDKDETHSTDAEGNTKIRKVVMIKKHGDGEGASAGAHAIVDADGEVEVFDLDNPELATWNQAHGQRVTVIRQIRKQHDATTTEQ
jgi:hypothetical protein